MSKNEVKKAPRLLCLYCYKIKTRPTGVYMEFRIREASAPITLPQPMCKRCIRSFIKWLESLGKKG